MIVLFVCPFDMKKNRIIYACITREQKDYQAPIDFELLQIPGKSEARYKINVRI